MELNECYQPARDQVVIEIKKSKTGLILPGKADLDGVTAFVRAKGNKAVDFLIGDEVTVTSGAYGVILDKRFDKFKKEDTESFFQIREMDLLGKIIKPLVEENNTVYPPMSVSELVK